MIITPQRNPWIRRISLFGAFTMAGVIVVLCVMLFLKTVPWSVIFVAMAFALSHVLSSEKENPDQ